MKYIISRKSIFSAAVALICLSIASSNAFAEPKRDSRGNELSLEDDWYFGCFPEKESSIGSFPPPNILFMLDISGSMRHKDKIPGTNKTTADNRLTRAVKAVQAVIDANEKSTPRLANFGLAQFTKNYTSSSIYDDVKVLNECAPDNESAIEKSIWSLRYGGNTPTDTAIEVSKNSSCIQHPAKNQSAATALITDGYPSGTRGDALAAACEHRKKAPLYVIGLGPGTDQRFNNVLAAAGGTGTCTGKNGLAWDPCDHLSTEEKRILHEEGWWNYNDATGGNVDSCKGAFSTTQTDELVDAFRSIVADVSCNFPLETVGISTDKIPLDSSNKYPWIQVSLNETSGGTKKIKYYQDSSAVPGWTWNFINSSKSGVTLGKAACDAIKHQQVTSVKTRVGCICEQEDGSSCGGKYMGSVLICQPGTYSCDRGYGLCNSTNKDTVSDLPCQNTKYGICKYGHYACENGDIVCKSDIGPLPEVCNGIDDDCDGTADNISTSWDNKTAKYQAEIETVKAENNSVYNLYTNQACDIQNLCACQNNTPPVFTPAPPKNASVVNIYDYYSASWPAMHGSCTCEPD